MAENWIDEIEDRMKNADNACAVLELCHHSLHKTIRQDIKNIEYTDEPPVDLKFRQELLAHLEDIIRVCKEYGEYKESKFEEKMERGISRFERLK